MKRSSLALLLALAALQAVLGTAWAQAPDRPLTCDKQEQALNAVAFTEDPAGYGDAERACWVDWAQAQALAQGPSGQWVDVRDAGARRRLGLPGTAAVGLPDLADNAFLNHTSPDLQGWGYCVFGKVSEGMDVVDAIRKIKTGSSGFHQDVPKEDVIIERAEVV